MLTNIFVDNDEIIRSTLRYNNQFAKRMAANEEPVWADGKMRFFRSLLPKDPLFIDIGCGFGRSFPTLRELGIFRIIGIDNSREMLRLARQRFPDADLRIADICEDLKDVVSEECDGFLCTAVLMQIPRRYTNKALENIRVVLKTGAVGHIATPRGNKTIVLTHENKESIPAGHTILLEQWELDDLHPILERSGFQVVEPTFYQDMMLFLTVEAV